MPEPLWIYLVAVRPVDRRALQEPKTHSVPFHDNRLAGRDTLHTRPGMQNAQFV
jgi:hypothetical protein